MASETAHTIASIVPDLPDATVRELERLVAHSLAVSTPSRWREGRLGLLCDLSAADGAGHIKVADYDHARGLASEPYPSGSQLSRTYGGWAGALAAAEQLWRSQAGSRVVVWHERPYARRDCVAAICGFYTATGCWPTPSEYAEWRRLRRRTARLSGNSSPRLPDLSKLRRAFGDWPYAIAAAQRWRRCGALDDATGEREAP